MRRELGFWLTWYGGLGLFSLTTIVLWVVGLPFLAAVGVGIVAALGYVLRSFLR